MELSHIFDTHSHYDDPAFSSDCSLLISSLFERGISGIVHASTDSKSVQFGISMSEKYPCFYVAAGIHPEYADNYDEKDVLELEKYFASKKVLAVGEIGLDYHYEGYNRERQITLFRAQVELANKLGLPVIVHSRDATGDCIEILKELKPKGILHCFSGSWETAKEVLSLGMYIGFTGVLTFKNSKKAVEVCKKMPLERLLLETDCPYMAPEPNRGKRCDSSMILYTAKKAAEIREISYEEIILSTEQNAHRVYGIN